MPKMGRVAATTPASWVRSMLVPVSSRLFGWGVPPAPGRVCNGIRIHAPPPEGAAGVADRVPVMWTVIGPVTLIEVSWLVPRPSAATAAGDARTPMVVAGVTGRGLTLRAPGGMAGNGVVAVSAAYWAGLTATTVICCPPGLVQAVDQTAANRRTPRTAATSRSAAGLAYVTELFSAATTASAPVVFQDTDDREVRDGAARAR